MYTHKIKSEIKKKNIRTDIMARYPNSDCLMSMKTTIFSDVVLCSLVHTDWHFRGTYCPITLIMEALSSSKT